MPRLPWGGKHMPCSARLAASALSTRGTSRPSAPASSSFWAREAEWSGMRTRAAMPAAWAWTMAW